MLSILRKNQEMTMHELHLSKPISVEVFSDGEPMDQNPWLRLGELQFLDLAIATCKEVVDKYLNQHMYLIACVLPPKKPLITGRIMALTRP